MVKIDEIKDYHNFEEVVFKILHRTNPIKIDWRDGGRDRGRDIEVYYAVNNIYEKVIIECKYFKSKSVNIQNISGSIDWAKVTRPSLLFFWIFPYLTPDTKDFLTSFSQTYAIPIDWEEQANILEYLEVLEDRNNDLFKTLRKRIINNIKKERSISTLEYEDRILKSDHLLIDRKDQVKILNTKSYNSYYIHGVSGVGKTQLVKHIAKQFYDQGSKIFWHTILIENDPKIQKISFLKSLSEFFKYLYNDSRLSTAIKEYDNILTNQLTILIIELIEKYSTKLFIDDLHKCKSEELLMFFVNTTKSNKCRIYFIAWYNIFDNKISDSGYIKYIEVIA